MDISEEEKKFYELALVVQCCIFNIEEINKQNNNIGNINNQTDKLKFLDSLAQIFCFEKGQVIATYFDDKTNNFYVTCNSELDKMKDYIIYVFNSSKNILTEKNNIEKEKLKKELRIKISNKNKKKMRHNMNKNGPKNQILELNIKKLKNSFKENQDSIIKSYIHRKNNKYKIMKSTDYVLYTENNISPEINYEEYIDSIIHYIKELKILLPDIDINKSNVKLSTLLNISYFSAKIYQSIIFDYLTQNNDQLAKYIRKISRYEISVNTLFGCLEKRGYKELFLNTNLNFIEPEITNNVFITDWAETLKKYNASDEFIEKIRKDLKLYGLHKYPKKAQVPVHAEMNIVKKLLNDNLSFGVIGVSKYCCYLCSICIEKLKNNGKIFNISGTHGKAYGLWKNPSIDIINITELKIDLENKLRNFIDKNDPKHNKYLSDSDNTYISDEDITKEGKHDAYDDSYDI